MVGQPIPTLETERFLMRAPEARDFDAYATFLGSPRSVGVGGPRSRDEAFHKFCALSGHWPMRGFGRWIVADKTDDIALGIVGLMYPEDWPEPEIAWSVFEGVEGKGVAYEAAIRARQYAYETLGWSRVISCTVPDNTRSIALAKRMGAVREGDFQHPNYGTLFVWRHLSPLEL